MKALILAGGYGTRLYPLTINLPKSLLKVGDKPLIEYIISKIEEVEDVDEIIVVTNNRFYNNFQDWVRAFESDLKITLLNDETNFNEDRLGAIKDIKFAIDKININEDLLVVGGDNLFEFNLDGFVQKFYEKKSTIVGLYDIKDIVLAKQYGVVNLDETDKIVNFVEKSDNPITTLTATCIYIFPKDILSSLDNYIKEGNNTDAPGNYIKWLIENYLVYGYLFKEKWFDIGSKKSYDIVNNYFKV